jgi:hypothetical protein
VQEYLGYKNKKEVVINMQPDGVSQEITLDLLSISVITLSVQY